MAFNSVYVLSPQQPYPPAQKELERMRPSSLTRAFSAGAEVKPHFSSSLLSQFQFCIILCFHHFLLYARCLSVELN